MRDNRERGERDLPVDNIPLTAMAGLPLSTEQSRRRRGARSRAGNDHSVRRLVGFIIIFSDTFVPIAYIMPARLSKMSAAA